jgi:2-iminobutanoate/2-iminopropanoate deaminase
LTPFALSLSKGSRSWFDKLTTNGKSAKSNKVELMMEKIIIATPDAPKAIGPYSQAVRVGDFLFLSGQIPINPATGEIVTESFAMQVRQVFKNIAAVLKAAGADFTQVVKATVFLKNMDNFAEMNGIYAEFFPLDPPARSAVQAAKLPKDVEIEIEMIACLG